MSIRLIQKGFVFLFQTYLRAVIVLYRAQMVSLVAISLAPFTVYVEFVHIHRFE